MYCCSRWLVIDPKPFVGEREFAGAGRARAGAGSWAAGGDRAVRSGSPRSSASIASAHEAGRSVRDRLGPRFHEGAEIARWLLEAA